MVQVAPEQSVAQSVGSFHKLIRPTFNAWPSCKEYQYGARRRNCSSSRLLASRFERRLFRSWVSVAENRL
jgi:hypothetical protein